MRERRKCKTFDHSVDALTMKSETRACPAEGCTEKELVRYRDGEFDSVCCPKHGWQYPIPPHLGVPDMLMPEFLRFANTQPRRAGVHRELVYTPARWGAMADEFMRRHEPPREHFLEDA